ncbi:hypothetical protein [Nocardioides nanhaiensis]
MTGPEALHAQIISGNPGTLRTLVSDLRDAVRGLDWCVDHIVQATEVPSWFGLGAQSFGRRCWATEATAQVAGVRCDRAKLGVERMLAEQEDAHGRAEQVITTWRTLKPQYQPIPLLYQLLRTAAISALGDIKDDYDQGLPDALELADSDELTEYQEAWFGMGLLKLMQFDQQFPTNLGPPIPDSLLGGDDEGGHAAQGLGVDGDGNLLQTSYNDDGEAVLSVIDTDTGEVISTVNLGEGTVLHDGMPVTQAPDHAGGVMVDGDTVYVMSSTEPPSMYEYSLDDVRGAAPGETVPVQHVTEGLDAGAYSTISDGVLYVGTHNKEGEGFVQPYVRRGGEWVENGPRIPAPRYAQGIGVDGDTMYFTSSLGRGNSPGASTLHAVDATTGEPLETVPLPHMAEGLALTDQGIVVTYESGSDMYDQQGDAEFGDLFPSPSMTVTPYSELGTEGPAGEVEVETYTLQQAAQRFAEAQQRLEGSEQRIRALTLPASALGEVPSAGHVASQLDCHLDQTARWLRNGHLSAHLTVDGLLSAAAGYDESDHRSQDDFSDLLGLT